VMMEEQVGSTVDAVRGAVERLQHEVGGSMSHLLNSLSQTYATTRDLSRPLAFMALIALILARGTRALSLIRGAIIHVFLVLQSWNR